MKKVLVTGGCGFIGSALVRRLIAETDHQVVNLDSLTYAGDPSTVEAVSGDPRYRFERVDIGDRAEVTRVFREVEPEIVFHLAAESHVDRSIDGPDLFVRTNVLGTTTLLDAARSLFDGLSRPARERFRFLYVSTDEVYGSLAPGVRSTERSPLAPSSPYAASKAAGDMFAQAYLRTYGLPVIVSHASNNYGPFQFPEKLIPTVLSTALEGRPIPVYGKGDNVRDWLFVDDCVQALVAIGDRGVPGGVYDVGAGTERSNLVVVEMLCALLDELVPDSPHVPHRKLIAFVPDRPGHDQRYAIDSTRLLQEIGVRPTTALEDGLRTTVRWYIEHRAWWERIKALRYDGSRLGLLRGPGA